MTTQLTRELGFKEAVIHWTPDGYELNVLVYPPLDEREQHNLDASLRQYLGFLGGCYVSVVDQSITITAPRLLDAEPNDIKMWIESALEDSTGRVAAERAMEAAAGSEWLAAFRGTADGPGIE